MIISILLANISATCQHNEKPRRWRKVWTNKKQTIPSTGRHSEFFCYGDLTWFFPKYEICLSYEYLLYDKSLECRRLEIEIQIIRQQVGGWFDCKINNTQSSPPVLSFILLCDIKRLDYQSKREGGNKIPGPWTGNLGKWTYNAPVLTSFCEGKMPVGETVKCNLVIHYAWIYD